MIGSNYAELNTTPDFNIFKSYPQKYDNEEYSTNIYQDGFTKNDESYYCGGNSSLAIRGQQMNNSPVSELYFSGENMRRIQSQLKREVAYLSKGKYKLVVDQDEADLLIMMRQVFFDHVQNLPYNIVRQVKRLNKHTVDYLIPDIMTNIKQNVAYLKEIANPINPIALPMNVSNAGRRSLPSVITTWGIRNQ